MNKLIPLDSKYWKYFLGDRSLLEIAEHDFDQNQVYKCEDTLCIQHTEKNILVDIGYYGDDQWCVMLVENQEWDPPKEEYRSKSLKKVIFHTNLLMKKYK